MEETTLVEQSKFDLGAAEPAIDAGELPWAYGENRITAMVRDPDSAYLYWEITDEGIAGARNRLGPSGQHGWCNLRVYDTTGREFDGTNANDYFDIRVERHDREYYLMIRRPSSSMHVEIGIKTHEGYFQPIARTGRANFPRSGPSPDTTLEWMTVTSSGAPPCVAPYRSRYAGPEPQLPGREGAGYVDVWRAAYAPSGAAGAETARHEGAPSSSWTTFRTIERGAHVERWWRLDEWRAEWRAGMRFFRWELFDPQRIVVELLGEAPQHVVLEGGEMVAYGPWRISIHGFESGPGRRVLSTWSMHWVRASTPMVERWEHVLERQVLSEYEREHWIVGASEQQRVLERGASELWRLGGSERVWLGASEWFAAGGSETVWMGASELAMAGASAFLYRGASERLGASERWMGASPLGGASEGAGELHVGVTGERWGGRLEKK
jgi:hypothetical protein